MQDDGQDVVGVSITSEEAAEALFGELPTQQGAIEDVIMMDWDGSLPEPPIEWMRNHAWRLITSIDELKGWWEAVKADTANHVPTVVDLINKTGKVYPKVGFDLETTGLDNRVVLGQCKTHIVGVCLASYAPNSMAYAVVQTPCMSNPQPVALKQCMGIYIPIAHKGWAYNLDLLEVVAILDDIFKNAIIAAQNGKFDFLSLIANGDLVSRDVPHFNYVERVFERTTIDLPVWPRLEDPQSLIYLIDSDRMKNGGVGLKEMSKSILKQEMIEFEAITSTGVKQKKSKKFILNTFDAVAPFLAVHYAAADAIETLLLTDVLGYIRTQGNGLPFIHQLDTNTINVQTWIEQQRVLVDREYLLNEEQFLGLKCQHTLGLIHSILGAPVNPDSTKILGELLFEKMKLPNKGKTPPSKMFKQGNWKTDKESLEELAKEHPEHAIFDLIVKYRELRNSYPRKLFNGTDPLDSSAKFSFSATRTPSGRFACSGGDFEKDGGAGLNVQAIQALYATRYISVKRLNLEALQGVLGLSTSYAFDPIVFDWLKANTYQYSPVAYPSEDTFLEQLKASAPDTDPASLKSAAKQAVKEELKANKEQGLATLVEGISESVLLNNPTVINGHLKLTPDGWVCMLVDCPQCLHLPEGSPEYYFRERYEYDTSEVMNLRRAFKAAPGWTFFSVDYSAIELRMVANLANETLWVDSFIGGTDLHASMAEACFGDKFRNGDSATKSYLRSMAKTITFGNLYGGTSRTIQQNLSEPIDIHEAKRLYASWIGAIPGYQAWVSYQQAYVNTYGVVFTALGRQRVMLRDLRSGDKGKISYAERTSLNHPAQGTSADILRLSLQRIMQWVLDNGLSDYVKLHFHVHDELDFSVKDEWVPFIVPNILRIMKCDDMVRGYLKWPVGLECDVEYGQSWDVRYKFDKKAWGGISALKEFNQDIFKALFKHISEGNDYSVEDYRNVYLPVIYKTWEAGGYKDPYQDFSKATQRKVEAFAKWRLENPTAWPTPEHLEPLSHRTVDA